MLSLTFLDSFPVNASGIAPKNISLSSTQIDFLGGSSIINELIGFINLQSLLFFKGTYPKHDTTNTNKTTNENNILFFSWTNIKQLNNKL